VQVFSEIDPAYRVTVHRITVKRESAGAGGSPKAAAAAVKAGDSPLRVGIATGGEAKRQDVSAALRGDERKG
jgi:hypothetical protein